MKKNRVIAMATAALLGMGTMSTGVWAADSYVETEKAWLAQAVADYGKSYGEGLAKYQEGAGGKVDLTLALGDGGRSIAGIFLPVDLSWFKDVVFSDTVTVVAGSQAQMIDVLVNGTKVCTVEFYMDATTADIYMRVPELSEAYIKVNQMETLEQSGEMDDLSADLLKRMQNPSSFLPKAGDVQDILSRYGNLFLDHVQDEAAAEETIEANGVIESATALQGTVNAEQASSMLKDIFAAAKADQQLKGIIDGWTEGNEEFNYDIFVQKIEEMEADLNEETDLSDEEGQIVSKIWLDENDQLVGRQLYFDEENGEDPEFWVTCWTPEAEGKSGLYIEFGMDGEVYALEGSGTLNGDLLSGTYTAFVDGMEVASFNVVDYDTEAIKDGILRGTYSFDLGQLDSTGSFQGFIATATFDGADKEHGSMVLDLSTSGVSLVTMTTVASETEKGDLPDASSFAKVYDADSEADMEAYTAELNVDALTANLESAGMPEGFIENLMALMNGEGAVEESAE